MASTAPLLPPLILPENPAHTAFHGYVSVKGREFRVRLSGTGPGGRDLRRARFECCPSLAAVLGDQEALVGVRLRQSGDAAAFFRELSHLVGHALRSRGGGHEALPSPAYYSRLVVELDALGWDHLVEMDAGLGALTLRCADRSGREHTFGATLHADYPTTAPRCRADLPEPWLPSWRAGMGLVDLVKQFRGAADRHLAFWEVRVRL